MISQIFLANLSEISLNLLEFMTPKEVEAEVFEDHDLCDRFVFSATENSLLVTPRKLNEKFLKASLEILGHKNVINLAPTKVGNSLCQAISADKKLFNYLVKIIKKNPGVKIVPYCSTNDFYFLTEELQKRKLNFKTPESPLHKDRWVIDFFGSKCGFRQNFTDQNFKILPPLGAVCSTKQEILGWSNYLIENFDGCVIKNNRGLAGAGLQIIRRKDAQSNVKKHLEKIIDQHDYFKQFPIVVERFIPPNMNICGGAPNIELKFENGKIKPLYLCGMRVSSEGVFAGVEIGRGAVPEFVEKQLLNSGKKLGRVLGKYGYNGFFEIDWVIGLDHKIFPIETNLRRTGGTHVFDLGVHLLGGNFMRRYYLTSNNRLQISLKAKFTYDKVVEMLKDSLYSKEKKCGIVLTIISGLSRGRLGYVVIGKDKKEAMEIENKLLDLVGLS